ncbi:GNAT family N-acetyltransferase [Nesterenkonia sp. CF4.4]|uniref:GNAT family N-acetyltransferase n=1 Tax=Nesterenkonia sp. CF4.4 TaxID=3373079 RepID=UPI003EE4FA1D
MPQPSDHSVTPARTLEELWPPFGLFIESPRLVMRVVREADFPAYAAAAASGVTHTSRNPFRHPWNEKGPEDLVKGSLPFLWSTRSAIGPDHWHLALGVFLKVADDARGGAAEESGTLIGMQDCYAQDWTVLRTISSGSWLRADRQGEGVGTEARAAMLLWAFDHFGAEYAESGAYTWNERSRRVSETLGYFTSGTRRVPDAHGEKPEWEHMFRLPKNDLLRPRWQIQVTGNDALKSFYGHD